MTRISTEQYIEKLKEIGVRYKELKETRVEYSRLKELQAHYEDELTKLYSEYERSKDRVKLGEVTIYDIKPSPLKTGAITGKVKYMINELKALILWNMKILLYVVTGRMKKAKPEKRDLASLVDEAVDDIWVINVNANLYASTDGDRFFITHSLKFYIFKKFRLNVYIFKTLKLKQEFLRDQ